MTLLTLALLTASPEAPDASGLHALCMDLSAAWQVGQEAPIGTSDWGDDPAAVHGLEASAWTCRYKVRSAPNPGRFFGVATVRLREAAAAANLTHLALGVTGLGWVHLGLLIDRSDGSKGRVRTLVMEDRTLGPEPEVLVISEVDDGDSFVRTAHLCVDSGPKEAAHCFAFPLAYGEGRGRRREADRDRVELRLERDGRIAFDQPPGTELSVTAPFAGVHDIEGLLSLTREHGRCDEGPCLRVLAFDVPESPPLDD